MCGYVVKVCVSIIRIVIGNIVEIIVGGFIGNIVGVIIGNIVGIIIGNIVTNRWVCIRRCVYQCKTRWS